jgi:hypothetical protein
MLKKAAIQIMLAVAVASMSAQAQSPYPPAPGHEKLPVVFWSHYMMVVGTFALDKHSHSMGGNEAFPFVSYTPDSEEQHIRYALESGINGFQMFEGCPAGMQAAAEKIFAETGQRFYLNIQWGANQLGNDFDKAVARIGNYALAHRNDPHVFCVDGKQVHFFWGGTGWAGKGQELFPKAREIIKAKTGVDVLFIPYDFQPDKLILDRQEIGWQHWPFLEEPKPGPLRFLKETTWDGISAWGPKYCEWGIAQMVRDRLQAGPNQQFLLMPEISPGYDSSNRYLQATHTQAYGMKVFRDNLSNWVRLGFRQLSVITWNDMNESMILPSTRSPFGFARIGRYYQQLAVDGTSPFSEPKVVVAYDPETMYGDELYFQFLVIPETGAITSDYICNVRFEDQNGKEVASLTTRATVPDQRTDALTEARLDTTGLAGNAEVLSPVVTVYRADRRSNQRTILFSARRLAPITLRYNQIQSFTPYVIALDRVAADFSLSLSPGHSSSRQLAMKTGDFLPLQVAYAAAEPLRRITLAEGRWSRGAFRADDQREADKRKLFLRVRCDRNFAGTLEISSGSILEVFYPNHQLQAIENFDRKAPRSVSSEGFTAFRGITPVAAASHNFAWFAGMNPCPEGYGQNKPVFRLEAAPEATLRLIPKGSSEPVVETTIAALAAGPLTCQRVVDGAPHVIRLELVLDAIEANADYPLPAQGEYLRYLNVDRYHDATRYFHAWALTKSDKIAYSLPLLLTRDAEKSAAAVIADGHTRLRCPIIRTRGVLDDFVDGHSSASRNPFEFSDVGGVELEARHVPYILLDCDEGTGGMLNNGGTGHQIGWAWIGGGKDKYEWLQNGWSGSGLRLKNGGFIRLRSKSFPPGAYTFSARIRVDSPATTDLPVAADGDHWQGITTQGLSIDLLPDGRVKARREIGSIYEAISNGRVSINEWNHLAVTYDLQSIRIFLNGTLAAEAAVSKPSYQRTHSVPGIGFSKVAAAKQEKDAPAFSGDIDQIEIIGTALTPEAVAALYEKGQWMAR